MHFLEELIADSSLSIRDVLKIIDLNCQGICFLVEHGKLVGVVTDGDIRRSLINDPDIQKPVHSIMNTDFVCLPVSSSEDLVRSTFTKDLKMIPLVDSNGSVVDVADVKRSHRIPVLEPALKGRELEYITDCIQSNWISSQGQYVSKFQHVFEKLHKPMHALAVSNGTNALHLALYTLGIGFGDEVIVPNVTFAATINSVIYCGATPVLCEIDQDSWCIDFDQAEKLISSRTKAIIPVHLYGQVCDIAKLCKLACAYSLYVIEDCAESLGSRWLGQLTGTFGDVSTFSFFGNKTISTGEGGMVLFKDCELAAKAKVLRDHGMNPDKRYWHDHVGFNYRLTNIQAAIGVAQMENFDTIVSNKINVASQYSSRIDTCLGIRQLPMKSPDILHSNWLFTLLLDDSVDRDRLSHMLLRYGIDSRPVFYPLSMLPPYKDFPHSRSLDISIKLAKQGISLPSSSNLSAVEIDYIIYIFNYLLRTYSTAS